MLLKRYLRLHRRLLQRSWRHARCCWQGKQSSAATPGAPQVAERTSPPSRRSLMCLLICILEMEAMRLSYRLLSTF